MSSDLSHQWYRVRLKSLFMCMQIPESMRNWSRNSWIKPSTEVLNLYITACDSVYHLKKATLRVKLCLFERLHPSIRVISQEFPLFLWLWTCFIAQNVYHQNGFSSVMHLNIRRNWKYFLVTDLTRVTALHCIRYRYNTYTITETSLKRKQLKIPKHTRGRLWLLCWW